MNDNILREIGLSESEKNVYLALLELGDSTRGAIVYTSGVAGSKVYELLEKLQEKGLVSIYIRDKVKHFKPTNPKQILTYLHEKKEHITTVEKQAQSILPHLLDTFYSSKEEREVEMLTGLKGLEIMFREQVDLLKPGETCYVIGGTIGSNEEAAVLAFFVRVHDWRQQKGIKTKMLYNIDQRDVIRKLYSSKKYKGTTTRFIEHTSPVAINVHKDRTIIIIFGKKITSIYIKSQDIATSFIEYFNILWKQSQP